MSGEQRIRILPESVINQIAAGEVILRPASIIKELGENALDAEAYHITFWTKEGGKAYIQVMDDGIGMSAVDAELCFERYATSKISSVQDLYRLTTKGFRGEALASIAAVAEVELFTRRPQDLLGTHVQIAFGKKEIVEAVRCPPGTTLIVRRLFHRLPVRRKSLRSEATEHRHNLEEFLRLALPHPERHFVFYHDDMLIYDLPPEPPEKRLLRLYPELSLEDLLPFQEELPTFRIRGYLVLPAKIPPRNKENFLFINRRYIRHGGIQQGLAQLYKPLLAAETRPLYWLFLEVPPAEMDVNITPSKTEVRLLHEMEIRAMLVGLVRRVLAVGRLQGPLNWLETPTVALPASPELPVPPPPDPLQAPELFGSLEKSSPLPGSVERFMLLYERYLILQIGREYWLLDTWGAYQRILYERYLRGLPISPQGLLFPPQRPISPRQMAYLQEVKEALSFLGIRLELREGREAVLHSLPAGLPPSKAREVLEEILAMAEEGGPFSQWRQRLAQYIARQTVPTLAGVKLAPEAVDSLWQDLQQCQEPDRAPDGRPIRYRLTPELLQQLFGKE
ncbi:MAG: DNA mismatch repair endonuclease MutL [Bacteroidia bacterium]|nr:DNA mismatch repair endonuclease MutL [Bacteroidia bacterium]MDW8089031.1 DNA mismatch repair endonuclease MutL [Bacteroidia bacterium]